MPAAPTSPVPARAGVGLKQAHYAHILERRPDIGWFEAHPENYMGLGGPPHRYLEAIRRDYPLSFHAVGLSLGSDAPPDPGHLARLVALARRYAPGLVSEHLSWSTIDGAYFADLLPLPYTTAALAHIADNVARVQDALGMRLLIENPSLYVCPAAADMDEHEFLAALCCRSGCGVLLDVNNAYVSARNIGCDPAALIDRLPPEIVGEIHLAGHAVCEQDGVALRIDDHGSAVRPEVWSLFERAVARFGKTPVLVEWDTSVPPFETLAAEAAKADAILARESFASCAGGSTNGGKQRGDYAA